MIEHGKNGILCDTDSDSIRAAIETLMKDEELKHTLGKNARNTIVEGYSLNKILKLAELGKVITVGSDVLSDELEEIVDTRKSMEV